MKTNKYRIDLKLYKDFYIEDLPFRFPMEYVRQRGHLPSVKVGQFNSNMENRAYVRSGYYSILFEMTEKELDKMQDRIMETPDIKQIGLTPISQ